MALQAKNYNYSNVLGVGDSLSIITYADNYYVSKGNLKVISVTQPIGGTVVMTGGTGVRVTQNTIDESSSKGFTYTIAYEDGSEPSIGTIWYRTRTTNFLVTGSELGYLTEYLNVGESFSETYSAENGTSPLVWVFSGLPDGLSATGAAVSGTPTTVGNFTASVNVTDADGKIATATIYFYVSEIVSQPVIGSKPFSDVTARVGDSYSKLFTVSGGTSPYTWSYDTLPSGILYNQNQISGKFDATGITTASITVTDFSGKSDATTIRFNITASTSGPVITGAPFATENVKVGEVYSRTFLATSGQTPYAWSFTNLPAGLAESVSIDGKLIGTFTTAGTKTTTITVTDALSRTASASLVFVVSTEDGLTANEDYVTTPYNTPVLIDVLGNDNGVGSLVLTSPYYTQPAHGSVKEKFDSTISNFKLLYTPNDWYSGSDSFTYTVGDGTHTAVGTVYVTVNPPTATDGPKITNAPSDVTVDKNSVYTFTFTASGGVAPYEWIATNPPTGITINSSTGELSGTPTTAGVFSVGITVADSQLTEKTDYKTVLFTINEIYTAVIQGTLRLDTSTGAFAARTVYLYNYTTGDKVAQTTSDGATGAWSFTAVAPGDYFIVGAAQGDDLNVPRDFDALGVITVTE